MAAETGPLEAITQILPEMPDEAVESQLLSFDTLAGTLGCDRPSATQLLRDAAQRCADPSRRERLLRAARDFAREEPCALTEQGLTWKQAMAANTITLEEWQEQEAAEQAARLAPDPPPMPSLGLWDLYPGMAVRIAQTFHDFDGQELRAGEILHFTTLDYAAREGGYTITFAEKQVRLCELVPANEPMIENEGNRYFEPIVNLDALKKCLVLVERQWNGLKIDHVGNTARIRSEINMCRHWLLAKDDRGPAPVCISAPLPASAFPNQVEENEGLAFRIAFLFAGVRNCADAGLEPIGTAPRGQ